MELSPKLQLQLDTICYRLLAMPAGTALILYTVGDTIPL